MQELSEPKSTVVNTNQAVERPKMIDWSLVAQCKDEREAIVKCVHLSRLSHETIRESLGIDKGHFSRIMQGRGHFPTHKRSQLMQLCGNVLPAQFEAMKLGYQMFESQLDKDERECEERLAQIREQKISRFSPFLRAA